MKPCITLQEEQSFLLVFRLVSQLTTMSTILTSTLGSYCADLFERSFASSLNRATSTTSKGKSKKDLCQNGNLNSNSEANITACGTYAEIQACIYFFLYTKTVALGSVGVFVYSYHDAIAVFIVNLCHGREGFSQRQNVVSENDPDDIRGICQWEVKILSCILEPAAQLLLRVIWWGLLVNCKHIYKAFDEHYAGIFPTRDMRCVSLF